MSIERIYYFLNLLPKCDNVKMCIPILKSTVISCDNVSVKEKNMCDYRIGNMIVVEFSKNYEMLENALRWIWTQWV